MKCLAEQMKKDWIESQCKNIQEMHNMQYEYNPKKTHKGDFATSQGGLSELSPLGSDGSRECQMGGWTSRVVATGTQI